MGTGVAEGRADLVSAGPMPRATMVNNRAAFALLAAVIIAFFPLTMQTRPSYCYKFSDVGHLSTVSCYLDCLKSPTSEHHPVFGTDHYSEDSDLCRSAIHAGVLKSDASHSSSVSYERDPHQHYVDGSSRNGITSQSKNRTLESTFRFRSSSDLSREGCDPDERMCDQGSVSKCIPQSWMCDDQPDCSDGTDEMNCETHAPGTPIVTPGLRDKHQLGLQWTLPANSAPADYFTVSHQRLKYKACETSQSAPSKTETVFSNNHFTATELDSYSEYKLCVSAANKGGESQEACLTQDTLADAPQVKLTRQGCGIIQEKYHCYAKVNSSCQYYNGPGFAVQMDFNTALQCAHRNDTSVADININKYNWTDTNNNAGKIFENLIPGQEYDVTVTPKNNVGEGTPVKTSVTTEESKPPKVVNLTAMTVSSSGVRLLFDDPCPSNGYITHLVYKINDSDRREIPASECTSNLNYGRCIDVENLSPGVTHRFKVTVRNSKGLGRYSQVSATIKIAAPKEPVVTLERSEKNELALSWILPDDSTHAEHFKVSYQLIKHKASESPENEAVRKVTTTDKHFTATELDAYSQYKMCVIAVNDGGQSPEACHYYDTQIDAPGTPIVTPGLRDKHQLGLQWTLPVNSAPADHFTVSYQRLKYKACETLESARPKTEPVFSNNHFTAMELDSYSEYEMCVSATNEGGESQKACVTQDTLADVPQVTLIRGGCYANGDHCYVYVNSSCQDYNGPGFAVQMKFDTYLQCARRNDTSVAHIGLNSWKWADTDNDENKTFDKLIPGQEYVITMTPTNDAGEGTPVKLSVTIKESEPPKVMNLTAKTLSASGVRLLFNDPCPSKGLITSSVVEYHPIGSLPWKSLHRSDCGRSNTHDRCVDVGNLSPETTYNFRVAVTNSAGFGEYSEVSATTKKAAPKQPVVTLLSSKKKELSLSWTLPEDSTPADYFNVSYQLIEHKACESPRNGPVTVETTTVSHFTAKELDAYSRYKMCVIAVSDGGQSPESCHYNDTHIDVPQVTLSQQWCTQYYSRTTTCSATVNGNCGDYNGPDFAVQLQLKSYLECNQSYHTLPLQENGVNRRNKVRADFGILIPGQEYEATMTPKNIAGEGTPVRTSVTTRYSKPPIVTNLTALTLSSSEVRLFFNDPCPSNSRITHLVYKVNDSQPKEIPASECTSNSTHYDHCIKAEDLSPGITYTFMVAVKNTKGIGKYLPVNATTDETEPGPPNGITQTRRNSSVTAHLALPLEKGGKLRNCSIELINKDGFYSINITSEGSSADIEISNLEQGKRYPANASCCTLVGCGEDLKVNITTKPSVPDFYSDLRVKEKNDTSITLTLPEIKNYGDGKKSMIVLVQHIPRGHEGDAVRNFTHEFIRLQDSSTERSKRSSVPEDLTIEKCSTQNEIFIAGILYEEIHEFTVGSGNGETPYPNCPLTPKEQYKIGLVVQVELDGERSFVEIQIADIVVAEKERNVALIIILCTVFAALIIVLIIATIVVRKLNKPRESVPVRLTQDPDDSDVPPIDRFRVEIVPSITETLTTPMVAPVVPYSRPDEPIYANVPFPQGNEKINVNASAGLAEESIYANISNDTKDTNIARDIPRSDIEAYLSQTINSHDLMEEFMSVPANADKSMDCGALPENKKKNRFRNNLPYDETRVKLSVMNNDPFSDYINANHIYGYGESLRYIATQGPKDANNNTIEDFWRMICEQEVTVIIMVANFVEGGKSKVGEYFRYGDHLDLGNYSVEVLHTDEFPKYNISTIQVTNGSFSHKLTHYHYMSWPDHGVPNETYTLGAMLRTIIRSHPEGCILVHCSAGIGRTGTVLLVLLLHEMLLWMDSIEPLQVLRKLRECRGRLVENIKQYNLGLKLYEEVEFGALHSFQSEDYPKKFTQLLKEVGDLHAKAKALPVNLKFSSASNSECISMNRSNTVFPADSCRVFLQMLKGKSSSQYMNAVLIDGIHNSSSVIVTEHPIETMTRRFWRLVMEKKCHSVVFINSFDGLEEDFPSLLPLDDQELIVGSYSLHMQNIVSYDCLIQSTLKIFSQQMNLERTVTVYQVTSWQYGRELPPSPEVLLGVCDLILKKSSTSEDAGPALLTCGDGVTGCGLMAGLLNVTDQLQRYHEVNIYRNVIRLLRVRKEFFASPAQMKFLYKAALCYIKMYSNLEKSSP